ncbi:MAG TPA: S41 family peptidase [Pyrinomonadaceae bacterium]|nr:S41 family peptidase [Pyrinomonadaceae bacterium]
MDKKFPILALLLIAVGAVVGGLVGRLPAKTSAEGKVTIESVSTEYSEALSLIDKNYGGTIDHEKVTDTSMQAMLWTLDPHSSFFDREQLKRMDEEQASQFYGIGVSILQHHNGVYVQSVVPGTPADKGGIRYGDRILTVEGKDATEWTSAEVSKNVRGPRGTQVKVTVERATSAQPLEFELVRGGVPLPSVRNSFMLPNSVGYIGFTGGFQQTSADEVASSIAELKKQGMKNLILDMRGNPGGILEQAVEIVSDFVPAGQTVVSVKSSRSDKVRDLKTVGGTVENFPMVMLINGGSASASEIVAGALQDYSRGLVVGTDSFGKGLVQRVFRLPYGTGLTLTTARYYTPYGRSLQRDYSSGSIYEYYSHGDADPKDAAPKPVGQPVTLPTGRVLYGGRGIEPDVVAEPAEPNPLRGRINEAAFLFARQIVAGKVAGFESLRAEKQSFKQVLAPGEFAVSDKLFELFKAFAANEKAVGLTTENVVATAEYAKMRLRLEIATAHYSSEAGIQVLLEADPQVAKAMESMPEAAKLMQNNGIFKASR